MGQDLPDHTLSIQVVAVNGTISKQVNDTYDELLDWDTIGLGKKMVFLEEAATGTEQDDIDLIETEETSLDDDWTKLAEWTIEADDLLTASFKRVKYDGLVTAPGTEIDYQVTYKRAGEDPVVFAEGTDTFTPNVYETKTHDVSPEVECQHEVNVKVRFWLKITAAGGVGAGKNLEVRYDDIHEPLDYQILTYAYTDGISHQEAQEALAAGAKTRVVISDVYAQVRVLAKAATAGRLARIRMDYIGISL